MFSHAQRIWRSNTGVMKVSFILLKWSWLSFRHTWEESTCAQKSVGYLDGLNELKKLNWLASLIVHTIFFKLVRLLCPLIVLLIIVAWILFLMVSISVLSGASGKEPTCQCRRRKRHRFNPWVGKIPWRKIFKPPQYSCLENPMTEEPGRLQAWLHDWVT